jgi:hypothetical protein
VLLLTWDLYQWKARKRAEAIDVLIASRPRRLGLPAQSIELRFEECEAIV